MAVEQGFAEGDHPRGDRDLIDHLGVLARARAAHQLDRLAQRSEQRLGALERHWLATHHDHERRVARTDVAA